MSDPAGQKNGRGGGRQIGGVLRRGGQVDHVAEVINSHDNHDQSAHNVDHYDAIFHLFSDLNG